MTTLPKISATDAARLLKRGEIRLYDVREDDEYAREHVRGAQPLPLSRSEGATIDTEGATPVFMCRSGNRTDANCARLAQLSGGSGMILEGGLDGWKQAGLQTQKNSRAPLELMRQVQIAAGSLVLAGVLLGLFVHPGFFGIAAFVGAGLTFAGLSGWCGMAKLLGVMPWNRRAAA